MIYCSKWEALMCATHACTPKPMAAHALREDDDGVPTQRSCFSGEEVSPSDGPSRFTQLRHCVLLGALHAQPKLNGQLG